jgi:hypothetical protein
MFTFIFFKILREKSTHDTTPNKIRVMLISAFGALVKNIKTINFCIGNNIIYICKRSITQVLRLFYDI